MKDAPLIQAVGNRPVSAADVNPALRYEPIEADIQKEVLMQELDMLSSICQMILAADLPVDKTKALRIREELQYRGRRFS